MIVSVTSVASNSLFEYNEWGYVTGKNGFYNMMLGSKAPDFDAYRFFRVTLQKMIAKLRL